MKNTKSSNISYYTDLEYIKKYSIEAYREALRLKYKKEFYYNYSVDIDEGIRVINGFDINNTKVLDESNFQKLDIIRKEAIAKSNQANKEFFDFCETGYKTFGDLD
jgi:hypothetical protein